MNIISRVGSTGAPPYQSLLSGPSFFASLKKVQILGQSAYQNGLQSDARDAREDFMAFQLNPVAFDQTETKGDAALIRQASALNDCFFPASAGYLVRIENGGFLGSKNLGDLFGRFSGCPGGPILVST